MKEMEIFEVLLEYPGLKINLQNTAVIRYIQYSMNIIAWLVGMECHDVCRQYRRCEICTPTPRDP